MSGYLVGVVVHGGLQRSIGFGDRHPISCFHREVSIHGIQDHVSAWHAGEQDGRALLGQQREDPLDWQRDAVLSVGNQHQLDEGPEDPADSIGKLKAL